MAHHLEGIAIAIALAACVYGIVWATGALKERQIQNHRQSIERYFEKRGEKLTRARWKPFGPGAQTDLSVLFEVTYLDADGKEHSARCKVGSSGVYLTDDELTGD